MTALASLPDRRYIRDRLKSRTGLNQQEVTLGIVDKMHDILAYSFIETIAPGSEIRLAA
jgi:hypothetical protein